MKMYLVTCHQRVIQTSEWLVPAETPEEAKAKVLASPQPDDVDLHNDEVDDVEGELEVVDVVEMREEGLSNAPTTK